MSKSKCKHSQTFWKFFDDDGDEIGICGGCGWLVIGRNANQMVFVNLERYKEEFLTSEEEEKVDKKTRKKLKKIMKEFDE